MLNPQGEFLSSIEMLVWTNILAELYIAFVGLLKLKFVTTGKLTTVIFFPKIRPLKFHKKESLATRSCWTGVSH